jgi:hypothetical protein
MRRTGASLCMAPGEMAFTETVIARPAISALTRALAETNRVSRDKEQQLLIRVYT